MAKNETDIQATTQDAVPNAAGGPNLNDVGKVSTPPLTDAEADRMARLAGAEINQQPRVRIRIPVDPLNPKDTSPVPVTINGYTWSIKRGETVEVPDEVARILSDAKYI